MLGFVVGLLVHVLILCFAYFRNGTDRENIENTFAVETGK